MAPGAYEVGMTCMAGQLPVPSRGLHGKGVLGTNNGRVKHAACIELMRKKATTA